MENLKLSIVIPAYNEESRLRKEDTLSRYFGYFSKIYSKNFELIVVVNGSSDGTIDFVNKFASKRSQVKVVEFKEKIGKGGAVLEGFKVANGELVGFVDADMSTEPDAFNELVSKINGYDCIIASRRLRDSIVIPRRTFFRDFSSIMFNLFVRVLFFMNYSDTQCGAKLLKREACKAVVSDVVLKKWAFDVDLLYSLKKKGFRTSEIATVWTEKEGTKLTLRTPYEMFLSLVKLRLSKW